MQDITLYILAISNFVQALVKQGDNDMMHITPFQIDVPIALKKIQKVKVVHQDEDLSGDDSDSNISDDVADDEVACIHYFALLVACLHY